MKFRHSTLLFLLMCIIAGSVKAQVNYTFSTAAGTYTPIAGGTTPPLTLGNTDDGCWNNVPIGFNFNYNGPSVFTAVHANTNGFMAFGAVLDPINNVVAERTNDLTNGLLANRALIAPLWDDIETPSMTHITSGPVGSRVFTMQWNNVEWVWSSSTTTLSMQVKFYETTNVIEFMYSPTGNAPQGGPTASIGITATGTGSGNFMSLQSIGTPTVNTTAEVNSLSTVPASTVIYRFTPTFCSGTVTAGDATVGTSTYNCTGSPSLNLTGSFTPPTIGVTYTWQSSPAGMGTWSNISGALTSPAFVAPATTQNTDYQCIVTCTTTGNTATSTPVTVTVLTPTAVLSGSPTVCPGDPAQLTVTFADGTPPYNFTYNDGVGNIPITGIMTSPHNFTVAPTTTTLYTSISVSDVNCAGTVSGNAVVNVHPTPVAAVTATSSTVCAGESFDMIFVGTPDATVNYFDNGNPASVTLDNTGFHTVTLTPTAAGNISYVLFDVQSIEGCTASLIAEPSADVTVNASPTATITNGGASTICDGATANLSINLGGSTGPWSFTYSDGTNNFTENNYGGTTFPISVTPSATVTYSIVDLTDDVNGCDAQTADISDVETITVEYPVSIGTQPSPATECTGMGASFSVVATGGGLTYQWLVNGNPILSTDPLYTGYDQATLTIPDISGLGGNIYSVVVSGSCSGPVTSDPATLTVNTNNIWDGSSSDLWSDPDNWSCTTIPVVTTDVIIPMGVPNMPSVNIPGAICHNLTVDAGATVIFTGAGNQLEIHGDVAVNGSFDGTGGKILLGGPATQNVTGITTYEDMEISGGSEKNLGNDATVNGILTLTNGYLVLGDFDLTIADLPAQPAGSSGSHIVTNDSGLVIGQNMGITPSMFHIGAVSGSYTPIMLENEGDADTFAVRAFENVYMDGYGVSPELTISPVVNRTWLVTEQTTGGSFVNMTPHWNVAEEINGFDQTHVYVGHHIGGQWTALTDDVATAPPAGTSGSLFTAFADSIENFSPFTVASFGQFPLSIEKLTLTGTLKNNDVLLNWITVNEKDVLSFDVERSVDGKRFEKIGSKKAIGTDNIKENKYNFSDINAVNLNKDKLYYRLNINEKNSHTFKSKVVSVNLSGKAATGTITLYPNPVGEGKDKVFISMENAYTEKLTLGITDIYGKVINTMELAPGKYNAQAIPVEIRNLISGVYMIRITDKDNNTIEVLKFVKE